MVEQVYRARRPRESPLWQCLSRHFYAFLELYEEGYQPRYGFLQPPTKVWIHLVSIDSQI